MSVYTVAPSPERGPGLTEAALFVDLGNDHGGSWGPGVSSLEQGFYRENWV